MTKKQCKCHPNQRGHGREFEGVDDGLGRALQRPLQAAQRPAAPTHDRTAGLSKGAHKDDYQRQH